MSSNPSGNEATAARGLDLNFAATAVEHQEPSPEAGSDPFVDVPCGSVSETLGGADVPKAGDGSSGGAKDGVLGGGNQGWNQSTEAEDSFVDAKPEFEEEGDGVPKKGAQETDSRPTGETLIAEVDLVQKKLGSVAPAVVAESLDGSAVEGKAGDKGGSEDPVAADAGAWWKSVSAEEAKSAEMPLVDEKAKDKDVVVADVRFDVVMTDENAEGDSKLGVETSAPKAVELAKSSASLLSVECQEVTLDNDGSSQKTEVFQGSDADEKVSQVKNNMEDLNTNTGTGGIQSVQVSEQEMSRSREKQRRQISDVENGPHVRYHYAFQDENKDGYSVSDLVWGKVRSHPWWPGQIFDPSDASEMALKHQKTDHSLVAYFGDKTFAWCDESRLKPFQTYFPHMEKQSSMDAFVTAVDDALGEVSRLVELGMTCRCFTDEACADMKRWKAENAGIREGTCSPAVESSLIAGSFQPERLLDYVQALAQFPDGGADRLELLIAKAQLRSFYRSKGYTELPVFIIGEEELENDVEISPARKRKSDNDVTGLSTPVSSDSISRKVKRGRGRPPKQKNILEVGRKQKSLSELMEENNAPHHGDSGGSGSGARASSRSSGRRSRVVDSDSTGLGKGRKKRLDSLGDLKTKSQSPSRKRYSKVGECMRRVAGQMTGSPQSILSCNGETVQKSPAKANGGRDDVVDGPHTRVETPKVKRGASKDFPASSEMLSQLCLVARDPMKGYSFLAVMVDFFTDLRDSFASSPFKGKKLVEMVGGKRGRRKSTNSMPGSSETFQSDTVQDSYWSDIIISESPEEELASSGRKRKGESQTKSLKQKRKPEKDTSLSVPHSPQHLQVGCASVGDGQKVAAEGPMNNSEENNEECMPTALILSFAESDSLPSESDLISVFGRYGSLREEETEVLRKANRAKVVFKRRADAEAAFSSAGKYSIFGPALVSYQLRYLPSSPKTSPNSTPEGKRDALHNEGVDLEVSAQEETGAVDDMHV